MRSKKEELQKGSGVAAMISGARVAPTFDIPVLNGAWDPEDPESRATFIFRCRRWRVGEKDVIRTAAENMAARFEDIGEAGRQDLIGQYFEGGCPTPDESWNFCLFQALILGIADGEEVEEVSDLQLAEIVGQCPELCSTLVDGFNVQLKTQMSAAEQIAIRLKKKASKMIPPSTGRGEPVKPSTDDTPPS